MGSIGVPAPRLRFVSMLLAVASVVGACRRETTADPDAVAMVGGRPVLATALEAELRRRSGGGLMVDKDKVLSELIDLEAAYGKAMASGFLDSPEIQRAIRVLVAERMKESHAGELQADPGIGEERARALYLANTNRFVRPAAWNVAVIKVEVPRKATPDRKAAFMELARALRARAAKECAAMSHFGPVAAEVSVDQSTRYRGGELGWQTEEQMQSRLHPEVASAALQLSAPGDLSEPVVASDGIYLLKLMGRRGPQLRPFDEVRAELDHELALRARGEREARWSRWVREGLSVAVLHERLAKVEVPTAGTNRPAPPAPMKAP